MHDNNTPTHLHIYTLTQPANHVSRREISLTLNMAPGKISLTQEKTKQNKPNIRNPEQTDRQSVLRARPRCRAASLPSPPGK